MAKTFNIFISSGISPGPYNVYYDSISDVNLATIISTSIPASGLTLNQLQIGVAVDVPDDAQIIIVYNTICGTFQSYQIDPSLDDYPCLCFRITYTNPLLNLTNEKYNFCYNYTTVNGRPQYENNNCLYLTWKGDYWELEGYTAATTYKIRSYDNDDIPDTNWFTEGFGAPDSIISVSQGDCTNSIDDFYIIVKPYHPTCMGEDTGSAYATAYGGAGGWVYSIDGINYTSPNGIFTNLSDGFYTIFAKDLSGNVVSQFFTLTGEPATNYYINGATSVTNLNTYNNMNYYLLTVNYNTSMIPLGETVTFDWRVTYNLFYQEPVKPGQEVDFDTSQQFLSLSGNNLSISPISSTLFTQNNNSPCNPDYKGFIRSDEYGVNNITLRNGDEFIGSIIYGINTEDAGIFISPCYTTASVGINLRFENVVESCNCCELNNNEINVNETVQNYQP